MASKLAMNKDTKELLNAVIGAPSLLLINPSSCPTRAEQDYIEARSQKPESLAELLDGFQYHLQTVRLYGFDMRTMRSFSVHANTIYTGSFT